jgi:glycosyltransferase involved in cell wall biosynthesis
MAKENKPKVMIVNERFYPLIGGAEDQCLQIGLRLIKRGYQVKVATKRWRKEFPKEELLQNKLLVSRIGIVGFNRFADYIGGLSIALFLIKNRKNFDILSVDSGIANIFASTAILTGKLLNKKVVAKFETPGELDFSGEKSLSPKKFVHPLIKLRLFIAKKADYYLAQTQEMGEDLVNFGISRDQIKSFPNSVDEDFFSPLKNETQKIALVKKLGLPSKKILVFFCGRLVVRKGLFNLLKAWEKISKSNNAVLVLIGSGNNQPDSVEEQLRKTVNDQKINDSVIFLGEKNREEVALYLKTADIFVYPSIHPEGRAVSVLEAMSAEVSVVVTDIGGLKEIVDNNLNGLLVGKNNFNDLYSALSRLINNNELRKKLGRKGREEVIKKYSLNKSAQDIDNYFVQINSLK